MKPYYLKFTDEAQAIEALEQFRAYEQWQTASLSHALDVIGVIVIGGKWNAEGNEIEAPTMLEGFHVNLMCETLNVSLEQYVVTPATPSRVFAGVI